jgi:cytochrome c2
MIEPAKRRWFVRIPTIAAVLAATVLGMATPVVWGEEGSDIRLGQLTLQRECTRCHSLDRVFRVERTIENWEEILVAMSRKPDARLSPEDFERLRTLHMERQRSLYAEGIFEEHCDKCHELERGTAAHKASDERWRDAINRMRGKDAQWISADEAKILVLWHLQEQEDLMRTR